MKFLKSSVLFISMACIVPVCSIAREKSERITRAEIEQKSADEFINGLMKQMGSVPKEEKADLLYFVGGNSLQVVISAKNATKKEWKFIQR